MSKAVHNDFLIPIKGLSTGKHNYTFTLDTPFFHRFDESLVSEAYLTAEIVLDKQPLWIGITGEIDGEVVSECDRCLEELRIPLKTDVKLIVKFARTEGEEDSDEVMILEPSEAELDLEQFFYDYVCLSLPLQRVHSEGECNEEMARRLRSLSNRAVANESSENSPFGKLKDLLN
jgi:uncharacterized metal-binding protein YceD (DUF177 family)